MDFELNENGDTFFSQCERQGSGDATETRILLSSPECRLDLPFTCAFSFLCFPPPPPYFPSFSVSSPWWTPIVKPNKNGTTTVAPLMRHPLSIYLFHFPTLLRYFTNNRLSNISKLGESPLEGPTLIQSKKVRNQNSNSLGNPTLVAIYKLIIDLVGKQKRIRKMRQYVWHI